MSKRFRMSKRSNKRTFKRGLKSKAINTANPMRGGIRL